MLRCLIWKARAAEVVALEEAAIFRRDERLPQPWGWVDWLLEHASKQARASDIMATHASDECEMAPARADAIDRSICSIRPSHMHHHRTFKNIRLSSCSRSLAELLPPPPAASATARLALLLVQVLLLLLAETPSLPFACCLGGSGAWSALLLTIRLRLCVNAVYRTPS